QDTRPHAQRSPRACATLDVITERPASMIDDGHRWIDRNRSAARSGRALERFNERVEVRTA
ncbi:MAG: hypothetical protein ACOC05_02790, partial [Oceanicaulis sp.]